MRYPPITFEPKGMTIYNGAATRSLHALEADTYQTWLACLKRQEPVMIGGYFGAGITYTLEVLLPQFTANARFGFLCSGTGSITVTCDDDTYNATVEVEAGTGHTGEFDVGEAKMVWFDEPYASASQNGDNRALDTTFQSSPRYTTFTWAITDTGASQALRVYSVDLRLEWPTETSQLPA